MVKSLITSIIIIIITVATLMLLLSLLFFHYCYVLLLLISVTDITLSLLIIIIIILRVYGKIIRYRDSRYRIIITRCIEKLSVTRDIIVLYILHASMVSLGILMRDDSLSL